MALLEKISRILNQMLMAAAGIVLAVMILMTCANIVSRLVWVPIKGTFELMGYFGAVVTAFALGHTQFHKGHIGVDILVNRFPAGVQRILGACNNLIGMVFFLIAGWQITKYANNLLETGEVTETLRIVYYPFTYCVALGCLVLALVLLVDFLKCFVKKNGVMA